jgi:hypothetical protein
MAYAFKSTRVARIVPFNDFLVVVVSFFFVDDEFDGDHEVGLDVEVHLKRDDSKAMSAIEYSARRRAIEILKIASELSTTEHEP